VRALLREWLSDRVGDPTEAELKRRNTTLLVVTVVLGLLLVWLNLMVQDLGYRTANLNKLIEKLDLEHAELQAEVAQETTPERLRRHAETRLGLGTAMPGQVMTVDARP
jgi:cell division protein FtsL